MSYEDQSEDVKSLSQREHNRDANAKRIAIRVFDANTGDWVNVAAASKSDGTYGIKTGSEIDTVVGNQGSAIPTPAALIGLRNSAGNLSPLRGVSTNSDNLSTNAGGNTSEVAGLNYVFDGTNWDRAREPAGDGVSTPQWFAQTPMVYNGSTYDRAPGSAADGQLVNLGSNNDIRIRGDGGIFGDGNTNTEVRVTEDGELVVAQTPQERNAYVAMAVNDTNTTGHRLFIDLSDTTTYPHNFTGRVDFSTTYITVDRDTSATGRVRLGVIGSINGTSANVFYFAGIAFEKSDDRHLVRDRNYSPSQIKTGISGGLPNNMAVNAINVTAINTGVTLTDAYGNSKTPAVGDIVFSYIRDAGNFTTTASALYHTESTA